MTDRARINLVWLLRLRRMAIVGQALLVLAVPPLLGLPLPTFALLCVLTLAGLSNFLAARWAQHASRTPEGLAAGLMLLDCGLLTALLHLSGGPFNPFSTLYLVNVALAAAVLAPRWSWALLGTSLCCFGALFFLQGRALPPGAQPLSHATQMQLHLKGMWVAFALAAAFIVYFVQRVTRALALRERELAETRERTARKDKVAALATLAAGAAHELATPLSTIAVVATELSRALEASQVSAEVKADLQLVRAQVNQCRDILAQLHADAGAPLGEPLVQVSAGRVVEALLETLEPATQPEVVASPDLLARPVQVPLRALARILKGLVDNARQASPDGSPVRLYLQATAHHLSWAVEDEGSGMPPEVLARAGEPFFTTKAPGKGMGLGLFLARALAEQLDGSLELSSKGQGGSRVILTLPLPHL